MPVHMHSSRKSAYKGPDTVLVTVQMQALQDLLKVYGAEAFCREMFWILRKNPEPGEKVRIYGDANKRLVPFIFHRTQQDIELNLALRNIMLKYRQGGYTTYCIVRRLLMPIITEAGTAGLLISQNADFAAKHFDILKRAYRWCGAKDPYDATQNAFSQQLHDNILHTQYSSRHELIFDQLDSRVMVASAEVEESGQGVTLHHVHCTEVARWPKKPEETLANLKEAIAPGGTLDLESTANGMGGYFYDECMRARANKSEFKYHFHEWWWQDEYRDDNPANIDEKKGGKALSEEERILHEKFKIDLYQIEWRRKKMISLRHNFAEKYAEDDITCFLLTGSSFFDNDVLHVRKMELHGYQPLESYRGGELKIFNKQVKGRKYVIGLDPASGRQVGTDTDYTTFVVLDEETGEEMASYRARVAPEDVAFDVVEVAKRYNNAMIAVERTGDGGTVCVTIEVQCQYGNLYFHKDWHKKDRTRLIAFVGFPTSTKTRPVALNILRRFVRTDPHLIWDVTFLDEGMSFVRDEKGKPEAQEGAHDDTVACRWIAHFCRLVNLGYLDTTLIKTEKYGEGPADNETPDAWEDQDGPVD